MSSVVTTHHADDLPSTATLWDRHDIARYLGHSVGSVNTWLRRHSVPAIAIIRDSHGRTKNLYSPTRVIGARSQCRSRHNTAASVPEDPA